MLDLQSLPDRVRLEVTRGELEAFATHLLEKAQLIGSSTSPCPITAKEILNINEAAELTGLARQTIYGKISQRRIPFYKSHRKVYFRKSELEAWMLHDRRKTLDEIRAEAENTLLNQKGKGGRNGN